jgi:predicted methyltransferase
MQKFLSIFLVFTTCFPVFSEEAPLTDQQILAILADPDRPEEDKIRDPMRLPAKILDFADVKKGDIVLDIFAGAGWYSELFSRAVGETGKVYAQNDEVIWRFAEQGIKQRTAQNRLPNLHRFDNMPIVDINIPAESVDIIFTALNYHDLFFTDFTRDGKKTVLRDSIVDYKAALAHLYQTIKKDGLFIIIDHSAKSGAGYDVANNQHRIDPVRVKEQMSEAGFTLVEEAFYLRNSNDNLELNVFDKNIRGRTDRFIYKFTKNIQ